MRKIKGFSIVLLTVFALTANAQSKFRFGAAIGINNASFTGRDAIGASAKTDLNVGVISEFKLPKVLGFELDILYSKKGSANINHPFLMNLNYVDIPLVVKLYVKEVISVQLGAQYSKLLTANFLGVDIKDEFISNDFAAVFGLGVDLNRIHLSFRYDLGIPEITLDDSIIKNDMVTVSLGVWLKK
jgi:hypothetical protein